MNSTSSPSHLANNALADFCSLTTETVKAAASGAKRYVGLEHIISGRFFLGGFAQPSDFKSTAHKFKTGDILYGKLRPYLDKAVIAPFDGVCSTEILVLRPKNPVDAAYLLSVLHSQQFIDYAQSSADKQYPRTSWNWIAKFPLQPPSRGERQILGSILCQIQQAIEVETDLIRVTRELKAAVMKKLFTEGLNGERQKETEIGLVPESWGVVELGSLLASEPQNGLYKPKNSYGDGVQILRIDDFSNDGDVVSCAPLRVSIDERELSNWRLLAGDIIVNRVNSLSHLGKTALIAPLPEPMIFESNMMRIRVDETKLAPQLTLRLLNSPLCKEQFIRGAKRAIGQASINQGTLRSVWIPLPSPKEQSGMIQILDCIFTVEALHIQKRDILTELFNSLLKALMSGAIRVTDFNIDTALLDSQRAAA